MEDRNEFEEDKEIDPLQLDIECIRQIELFSKWTERAIEAHTDADHAKFHWNVMEKRVELLARENPQDYGLSKATEGSVVAAAKCHKSTVRAHRRYLSARRISDLMNDAVKTMEMRERMLKELIKLHGLKYFAGPSVPRDLASLWQERQAQTTSSVNERQKNRARKRREKEDEND